MKIEGFLKQQPITILIDIRSTNNFRDMKVAAQMMLHIEDCSRFDVKVADGCILKCDQKCPWVILRRKLGSEATTVAIQRLEKIVATMPSTSVLPFPDRGKVFVIRADALRVGISATLIQDDRPLIYIKALPTLHMRLLIYNKEILITTKIEV
ncbi:hypothetical protein B296_00056544 [Ensete ventricosum]|uniref:Reverse transcriptase/retrotransposon-derived protein RNase H-like domain-containing protein n=1 Tax=Ensete ventricosum TaxID=4639 RepID=A0A426XV09_ENSVE|nr:hypothetical protein B296_00056544 [Ensete ventricosum]